MKLLDPITLFSLVVLAITFVGSINFIGPSYGFHEAPLSREYSFSYSSL